ncbi:hypothetical protein B566_EDAN011253 [Ephemera danica]|nr:hypothetical protein B566_EDAN011253 [Ephemera danica]
MFVVYIFGCALQHQQWGVGIVLNFLPYCRLNFLPYCRMADPSNVGRWYVAVPQAAPTNSRVLYPIRPDYYYQHNLLLQEFSEATTNEARMSVTARFIDLLSPHDEFYEQYFQDMKDRTNFKYMVKSEQFITEATTAFENEDILKAQELYTKAIANAPLDSGNFDQQYLSYIYGVVA